MLAPFLRTLRNLPDIWGEGALFGFSGMDGETNVASGFVASYAHEPYGLLFHTPRRRVLEIALAQEGTVRVATGDVFALESPAGDLVVAFATWHTVIGMVPAGARLCLRFEEGPQAARQGACWVSEDEMHGDVLALAEIHSRFALAYGRTREEACARAQVGLALDLGIETEKRLALYRRLPRLRETGRDRLLKKCFSVMKVNTLSAEGAIGRRWSTPDRVPHRDMWLWDSVFHTWGMNHLDPRLAWDFLGAMLDAQTPDGMIPHQVSVTGYKSNITQPPILAWGVWENYQALRDRDALAWALPRLERYLLWDSVHRDRNGNGLLEWRIEANERSRSGESGMDNSPRFDRAVPLDAVDFSTFAALDMGYTARIAAELGEEEKAAAWTARSRALSAEIHRTLWHEAMGFYDDRGLDGRFSHLWVASGFLPLLLDDIPPERVSRLIAALQNPGLFHTAFPVPTVAVSEPSWSTDMWRGPTWVNLNALIIRGLHKQGQHGIAHWLADKTVFHVRKYYERYGVIFEFFDAQDALPPPALDRKGPRREPYDVRRKYDVIRDYHFTASLTADLLLSDPSASAYV